MENGSRDKVVSATVTVENRKRVVAKWDDGTTTVGRVSRDGSGALASIDFEPCFELLTPVWVPEMDCRFFPSSIKPPVTLTDAVLYRAWRYICTSSPEDLPYLKVGSANSAATKHIQAVLQADGYSPGPIDGRYGNQTAAAARRMQRALGVGMDGEVGPQTYAALQEEGCDQPEPSSPTEPVTPPTQPADTEGLLTVPSVIGMDHDTANQVLANYGLHGTGGVLPFSESCLIGRQSPLPGVQVAPGTTVEWFMVC